MKLGAFSISLSVKDLQASKAFYEKLGFSEFGGDMEKNYLIMKNGNTLIGLFHGMFENNILTFNPGWDENANTLENFDDVREIQKDLKGKGVFLNFWGTWCKPCENEMPYMNELYPEYKEKGVEIIALDADETEIAVKNFVKQYDLKFPVAIDKGTKIIGTYGVGPLPTSFLIDKDGKVVEQIIGEQTKEQLEGYLKKITP